MRPSHLVGAGLLAALLAACASGPRPPVMLQAERALAAADRTELPTTQPGLLAEAHFHQSRATRAWDIGQRDAAELHAHLALQRVRTADNLDVGLQRRGLLAAMDGRRPGAVEPRRATPAPADDVDKKADERDAPDRLSEADRIPGLLPGGARAGSTSAQVDATIFAAEDARGLVLALRAGADPRMAEADDRLDAARRARAGGHLERAMERAQEALFIYQVVRLSPEPRVDPSDPTRRPVSDELRRTIARLDAQLTRFESQELAPYCGPSLTALKALLAQANAAVRDRDEVRAAAFVEEARPQAERCERGIREASRGIEVRIADLRRELLARERAGTTRPRDAIAARRLDAAERSLGQGALAAAEAAVEAAIEALTARPDAPGEETDVESWEAPGEAPRALGPETLYAPMEEEAGPAEGEMDTADRGPPTGGEPEEEPVDDEPGEETGPRSLDEEPPPRNDETTTPEPDDATIPEPDDATIPEPDDATVPEPDDATVPEPDETTTPEPDETTAPEPDETATPEPKDPPTPAPARTRARGAPAEAPPATKSEEPAEEQPGEDPKAPARADAEPPIPAEEEPADEVATRPEGSPEAPPVIAPVETSPRAEAAAAPEATPRDAAKPAPPGPVQPEAAASKAAPEALAQPETAAAPAPGGPSVTVGVGVAAGERGDRARGEDPADARSSGGVRPIPGPGDARDRELRATWTVEREPSAPAAGASTVRMEDIPEVARERAPEPEEPEEPATAAEAPAVAPEPEVPAPPATLEEATAQVRATQRAHAAARAALNRSQLAARRANVRAAAAERRLRAADAAIERADRALAAAAERVATLAAQLATAEAEAEAGDTAAARRATALTRRLTQARRVQTRAVAGLARAAEAGATRAREAEAARRAAEAADEAERRNAADAAEARDAWQEARRRSAALREERRR